MTEDAVARLRALLAAYAEREVPPAPALSDEGGRRRRAGGDALRTIVRPVLDAVMAELRSAGHEAATRDDTARDNAYPSVALSFTPRTHPHPGMALASAIIFRFDPRHGIVVQSDVKPTPTRRRVAGGGGERHGTMGADALTAAWVETKTLNFVDAVLKAN